MNRTTVSLVGLYLSAIVIANLTVAWFGPAVVIWNALLLISLDLTSRDRLHEAWHGAHLRRNMALLIASGSILSAALDWQALPVAAASFVAFVLSETADTLVYARLARRGWLVKTNGSNLVSAAVDSVVFLTLLATLQRVAWFGVPESQWLPWALVAPLALGQWGAKTVGGALWSLVLWRREGYGR